LNQRPYSAPGLIETRGLIPTSTLTLPYQCVNTCILWNYPYCCYRIPNFSLWIVQSRSSVVQKSFVGSTNIGIWISILKVSANARDNSLAVLAVSLAGYWLGHHLHIWTLYCPQISLLLPHIRTTSLLTGSYTNIWGSQMGKA
jgi:hypothetical protein